MHELSIAMSIVELAQEESDLRGGVQVSAIHLRLGSLSGVVKAALQASFEMACEGTLIQGARLVIEDLPILIACRNCQANRPVSSMQLFCCAECGTPSAEVIQGKEIEVAVMEIEEWDHSPA